MKTARKRISEILGMSKRELYEYLRSDNSLQPTDSLQIMPFEHGVKVLYYHKNGEKPYKTRVYLNNGENPDL